MDCKNTYHTCPIHANGTFGTIKLNPRSFKDQVITRSVWRLDSTGATIEVENDTMNICRFIPDFPSSKRIGKAGLDSARYLGPNTLAMSREQVALGTKVNVICKGNGTSESVEGIQVHRVKSPYNLNGLFELQKIERSQHIDVLHFHAANGYVIARFSGLVSSAPTVVHVHGTTAGSSFVGGNTSGLNETLNNALALARERLVWKKARRVIAVSDDIARELIICYKVPKDRVAVVYNGVDVDAFKPTQERDKLRKELGWEGRTVGLYVGQISPRKGLTYLIQAARTVCKERKDVVFALAGGVPSYQETSTHRYLDGLKDLAASFNIQDNVRFLGSIPNSQLPEYHSAADFFVFPSLYEGAPKAVLEAMSCAKPTVATDVGGIRALVGTGEGIIVPPASAAKLSEGILKIVGNEDDLKRMGNLARQKVLKSFTWKIVALKLQGIYEELV